MQGRGVGRRYPCVGAVDQLCPRGGDYIGVAECLAVYAALASFVEKCKHYCISLYTDNDGVLFSFIKGSSAPIEADLMIGRAWLLVADADIQLSLWRVTSASNIADGPSRGDFSLLHILKSNECEMAFPSWLNELWTNHFD